METAATILDEPVPIPLEIEKFDWEIYKDRLRVVALGDSTTETGGLERSKRWTGILESFLGQQSLVVNSGIGATSSNLGLFRWHRDVSPVKPHYVIVNFLLNDSHIRHYECRSSYVVQCTADRVYANLRCMFDLAEAMRCSLILWTPPPVPEWPDTFKSPAHLNIQLELCNHYVRVIERVASDLCIPLVNLWKTFPTLVKEYPGPYFNRPDGYHSNALSQPIIAKEIERTISEKTVKNNA